MTDVERTTESLLCSRGTAVPVSSSSEMNTSSNSKMHVLKTKHPCVFSYCTNLPNRVFRLMLLLVPELVSWHEGVFDRDTKALL